MKSGFVAVIGKANAGKSIADVKMGSTTILSEDENDAPDVFDAKVKVPAEGANITVEFVAMTQQLTIKHPNGPASNTITIKDATGKTYGSQINDDTNSDIIADIPVGTRLTIIFPVQDKDGKYVGSVLVNGKTIPTEMTADGTYVIKDFEMKEAVTMTVNVTILKKIDVSLDKDVTYTYNGEAQAVIYTATDNLSDIEVYYGKIRLSFQRGRRRRQGEVRRQRRQSRQDDFVGDARSRRLYHHHRGVHEILR